MNLQFWRRSFRVIQLLVMCLMREVNRSHPLDGEGLVVGAARGAGRLGNFIPHSVYKANSEFRSSPTPFNGARAHASSVTELILKVNM